ncbi:MAG: SGNH/GDSL hydrolase family protein [Pirellulaceae bacterium]|jgi:lysophospholipase L1-like esterase|nr:SGNH/GDSL hydrolase family protein [Pirellulaceae bacterium]
MHFILRSPRNRLSVSNLLTAVLLGALLSQGMTTTSVAAAPAASSLRLTLPNEFVAIEGIETGIYFDNIVLTDNPSDYRFEVECKIGIVEARRWSLPASSSRVGKYRLTITVEDSSGQSITTASMTLRVLPAKLGGEQHFRLLIIGDSLTHATAYPNEIAKLFSSSMNPRCQMLGTHRPTAAAPGVAHEGYGGWTWQRFVSKYEPEPDGSHRKRSSPFVFLDKAGVPSLDLARYFDEACEGDPPDFVVFMLGINDCFSANPDRLEAIDERIDTMFAHADKLIAAFRRAAPRAQLGVCLTTPPNSRQAAFEANYKDRYSRWGWKRIQHRLVERQLERFASHADKQLFVIPTQMYLDTIEGYPSNNGVHPNAIGYQQIGRTIHASLMSRMADANSLFESR